MSSRTEAAREILLGWELQRVKARKNEAGAIALTPGTRVTPEMREECREYNAELLALLAERETHAAETRPGTSEDTHSACCWKCRAPVTPPSLDEMVATLRWAHEQSPEVFRWPDATWATLRRKLKPGDVLAICRGIVQIATPFYDSALVLRDGKSMLITRRELQEAE